MLDIQRRAEIIGFTHWPLTVLDEQPRDGLHELLLYLDAKGEAERERDAQNQSSSGKAPKRRR